MSVFLDHESGLCSFASLELLAAVHPHIKLSLDFEFLTAPEIALLTFHMAVVLVSNPSKDPLPTVVAFSDAMKIPLPC
jgi:hypothetical protein